MSNRKRMYKKIRLSVIQLGIVMSLSCSSDLPTIPSGVTDIDGNLYHIIVIGPQIWMLENLKVTRYNNGDPITNLTDPLAWNNTVTTGAWCYYNNDESVNEDYGKHYNWYAVTDSRKICPNGWHVPSENEWRILANHLGGEAIAGGKMKEPGAEHWETPNTGASNVSKFTGLPGGTIGSGGFSDLGTYGRWWSSTEYVVASSAYFGWLSYDNEEFKIGDANKELGFCVRCIMD